MADQWSNIEVELIVADYFSMLIAELAGKQFNKAYHREQLRPLLKNRSDGSIEFKHQNISAVLVKLGLPFIKGYKPRWNYQRILEQKTAEYLFDKKKSLQPKFELFSDQMASTSTTKKVLLTEDTPPDKVLSKEPKVSYGKKPFKINYLEREQMNASLGQRGEELVIEYERNMLIDKGLYQLAQKVERISLYDDSAGFDILSRYENGTDKYIEVKTTKLSKETPIFFSKAEYEKSLKSRRHYNLYRVFNFAEDPRVFRLNGSFDDFCFKEPIQYTGRF